jgi:hypothetical protein
MRKTHRNLELNVDCHMNFGYCAECLLNKINGTNARQVKIEHFQSTLSLYRELSQKEEIVSLFSL